jgi:hypothetical protein
MKIYLLTLILFLCTYTIFAQTADRVKNTIDQNMGQIRDGIPIDEKLSFICAPEQIDVLFPILENYCSDTLPEIRKQAYRYLGTAALRLQVSALRTTMIEKLAKSCFDSNGAVVNQSLKFLTRFPRQDYSYTAKLLTDSLAKYSRYYKPDFYKLGAYVDGPNIETILADELLLAKSIKEKWHIHIALARLGNDQSVKFIADRLAKAEINNDFVNAIVPDLVYTRQKEVFDFLLKIILPDDKNCVTNNPDRPVPIPCGYYLVEPLAAKIEGFPVSLDEQGDLMDDLTPLDFENIRKWISNNSAYTIIDNTY